MSYGRTGASAGAHFNPIALWQTQDNLSKIWGHHAFKVGIYLEINIKYSEPDKQYEGKFNFASSTTNPAA